MKLPTVVVLAAIAAGAVGVSAPAYATTFADYSATSSLANIQWIQSANGTSGRLRSVGTPVTLDFLTPSLSGLGALSTTLDYSATAPASDPAIDAGGYLIQPNLSGFFKFVYTGSSFTVGGKTYNSGDTLLSGNFTGAAISGADGSSAGNVDDATLAGGTITYHSPLLSFGSGDKSYAIEMTSIANPLSASAGQSLNGFTATSTGSFEAVLGGGGNQGIPEPATWALMMVGIGGLGAALRRKARQGMVAG